MPPQAHRIAARFVLFAAYVLCAALSAAAQGKSIAPSDPCTIEGIVVRLGTNTPLNRARVELRGAEGSEFVRQVMTFDDGRFVITGVAPGRYRLFAERNGFVRSEYGQQAPGRPGTALTLESGRTVSGLVLAVFPTAVISGRIVDADRKPVAASPIAALRIVYDDTEYRVGDTIRSDTNDNGDYALWGLQPGWYVLRVNYIPNAKKGAGKGAKVPVEAAAAPPEDYATLYYPSSADPSHAEPVAVRAGGESVQLNFGITPVRGRKIQGHVFNAVKGEPAQQATVRLFPRDWGVLPLAIPNAASAAGEEGKFEFKGVAPGSYVMRASWRSGGKWFVARQEVDVRDEDLEDLNLVLTPGVDIQGVLKVEDAPAVRLEQFGVHLVSEEDSSVRVPGGGPNVRGDGAFTLEGVPEGRYRLRLVGVPEGLYLKSAYLGPQNVMDSNLAIARGGAPPKLQVVLSGTGGQVSGIVKSRDDLRVRGAVVVLVPAPALRDQPALFKMVRSDAYGQFHFVGIRPGDYAVLAWQEIEPGLWQDPLFLRSFERLAVAVRVAEASTPTVELRVIPAGAAPN
jgi:protocatechuate 3,4-dioxygenase beta subunit